MDAKENKGRVIIPEELFSRISEGDNKAFEELYYLSYKPLYAFLLSLTKNKDDADDIMQDTYIKIRGASHLYKGPGNPMAWIMKIAKNEYLMKQRQISARHGGYLDEIENSDALAFENINDAENRMFLKELFKNISEEDRNIIIMHVSMGMKHKEIADILDAPVGTVLSRYHRAMKTLKKAISSSKFERKEEE